MNVQEENTQNAVLMVSPKDTLLQSYNVLTLKDPNDILDFLVNPLAEPLSENMVNDDTGIKEVKEITNKRNRLIQLGKSLPVLWA